MPTVTTKGQVTIPKRVGDALGIHAGTEVEFEGNSVRLRKVLDMWSEDRASLPATGKIKLLWNIVVKVSDLENQA